MKIAIKGAGIAGLCVATELAARGAAVSLCDVGGRPGPHACSWWAGGMLAPYCEGEAAPAVVQRLGLGAADWWQAQGADVTRNGTLVIALGRDRSELDVFARRSTGHVRLDSAGLAGLEPDLADRFQSALFFRDEAHLSPREALATLAKPFVISPLTEAADLTIDCRGLAARDVLKDLRGVRGEMLIIRSRDIKLSRSVRLLHPRIPIYLVPRGDGVYMLGATQIESGERGKASVRSVLELLSAAYALHPAFGEAEVLEIGCDARPAFPDNLPRIIHDGNTIYANGLFRHGYLLAPVVAKMVAEYVLDGTKPEFFHEARH